MDKIERRRELARIRYANAKERANKEFVEAVMLQTDNPDIVECATSLLGSGAYKRLGKNVRKMLSGHLPVKI